MVYFFGENESKSQMYEKIKEEFDDFCQKNRFSRRETFRVLLGMINSMDLNLRAEKLNKKEFTQKILTPREITELEGDFFER